MTKRTALFILVCFLSYTAIAQGSWTATSASPVTDRYDDIFFINPDTGWAVSLDYDTGQHGQILKTTDGGASWIPTNTRRTSEYRDIAFLNSQIGFAGTLQTSYSTPTDSAMMYKTSDGGLNWTPVTNLPGPSRAGICGMRVINDSTLFACGRFSSPALLYKTTNRGTSWTLTRLDSLAGGLVDAYFFDKDTGFIVGASDSAWMRGRGVILSTTDGGASWRRIHVTNQDSQMCWKTSFPSRLIGYVSLETFKYAVDSQFFLKTIDGGRTWQKHFITKIQGYFGQGFDQEAVGFINDTVGWIGGRDTSRVGIVFKTSDGGRTWAREQWGKNLNRFRSVGNGIAYFSGKKIYKFQCTSTAVHDTATVCPGQNYTLSSHIFSQPGDFTLANENTLCDATTYFSLQHFAVDTPSISDSAGVLRTDHYSSYQWYLNGAALPADTMPTIPEGLHGNGAYYVEVSDSNRCRTTSSIFNVIHVGLSDISRPLMILYPDPVSGTLTVAGLADKALIRITDIMGQTLISDISNGSRKMIDVSSLPAGLYFLNGHKFVKQ